MRSELFSPPRLRSAEEERGRRVTWFELFFDLVFVLAVAALSRNLQHDHSLSGFLGFAGLAVPVWWSWVIYTFYADRFDTDDLVYRVAVMAGMLFVAAMAASLRTALHGGADTFVGSYLVVRAVPALLYLRAARYVALARRLARNYGTGSLAAACLWLPSLAVSAPLRYLFWVGAVAIELLLPLIVRRTVAATPMHVSHLGERFGLFTIIVLGEAVVSVGASVARVAWQPATVATAACAFALAAALWWIYFDFGSEQVGSTGFWRTQLYVFGHLPVIVSVTAIAAGASLAIQRASYPSLPVATRVALCGGVGLYLLSISVVALSEPRLAGWARTTRLAGAALAFGLLAVGSVLSPPLLVALLLLVLVVEVASEFTRALRTHRSSEADGREQPEPFAPTAHS